MRIYVAAKWEKRPLARTVMTLLEHAGHTITHDWTGEEECGRTGHELRDFLGRCAQADLDGVRHSEAIFVLHHDALCGGLVEVGVALADPERHIIVIGGQGAKVQPIFYKLPRVQHFEDLWSAVQYLADVEKKRSRVA